MRIHSASDDCVPQKIVDSIVTGVLGGKLSIDSKPGEGTRITLLIPVVAPEDAARLAFDPGESHAKRQ